MKTNLTSNIKEKTNRYIIMMITGSFIVEWNNEYQWFDTFEQAQQFAKTL